MNLLRSEAFLLKLLYVTLLRSEAFLLKLLYVLESLLKRVL